MLINLSNHPSADWSETQLEAAKKYGKVVDLPFPIIDPSAETYDIELLAETYEIQVRQMLASETSGNYAVHLMGELTFCFALAIRLQQAGIQCLVSTTNRQAVDQPDGSKISRFEFVRFREYPELQYFNHQ
jgi:hypothetical protein